MSACPLRRRPCTSATAGLSHTARPQRLGPSAVGPLCPNKNRLSRSTARSGAGPWRTRQQKRRRPGCCTRVRAQHAGIAERDTSQVLQARNPARWGVVCQMGVGKETLRRCTSPARRGARARARRTPSPPPAARAAGAGRHASAQSKRSAKTGASGSSSKLEHETRAGQKNQARDPETDHPSSHVLTRAAVAQHAAHTLPPRLQSPHQTRPTCHINAEFLLANHCHAQTRVCKPLRASRGPSWLAVVPSRAKRCTIRFWGSIA